MVTSISIIGMVGCEDKATKDAASSKTTGADVAAPRFDVDTFSDPTTIDNTWLPLAPGRQLTFEGDVKGAEGAFARRIVFTVTDLTKVVNGVKTRVMWERDYNDGVLAESEITFFAQDDKGSVWLLGEYPEEYEGEKFAGAPSTWVAGTAGAKAGILMPAEPRKQAPPFVQGLAPDVDFLDVARVDKVGQETCVPAACYKDVMVLEEWDPLAQPQDGFQLKFHAPGVGTVRVEARGGADQETLKLTRFEDVSPEVLAEARRESLRLDKRAYDVVFNYKDTAPAA